MRGARFILPLVALALATPASAQHKPGHAQSLDETKDLLEGFQAIEAWQFDKARGLALDAQMQRPDRPSTLALRGDVKLHMSDYAGAVSDFELARRAGVPDELLHDRDVAEAARLATDGYAEAVGEHFIIRYTPGRDEILVPFAFETLEAARSRIGELLGWKPESRVVLEIYPTAATLARVSSLTAQEIANSGTIALCRWNRLMVTTPRAIVFGYSWRDTLSHELTHLIIGGASKNTVPIWLHEGIAKYAETAWRGEPGSGMSIEQQQALKTAAKKNKLIPFEKMHPSMAKLKTQEETSLAFSEVFTFIEFLVDLKGWEGIRAVLRQMAEGANDEQAIEKVFGESLQSLEKKWMKSLRTRPIKEDPRQAGGSERKVVLKDRPDTPDDQLHGVNQEGRRFARAADLLYARGRTKAAQVELQKAFDVTASPLIGAKLAMVALAAGDLKAAEAAAREAIKGTPDLAGPNVTLAEVLVRVNNPAAAQVPLDRAIDVNPFDPRIHALTLQVLGENGDAKKRAHAERALKLLGGEAKPRVLDLGTGAWVTVEGTPFHRVYLRRNGEDGLIATGLVTPTAAFEIKPGTYELELVPPAGAPHNEAIKVMDGTSQGAPQRIVPAGDGS